MRYILVIHNTVGNGPSIVSVRASRKYRHYRGHRHYSTYYHHWLFLTVASDCTGTIAGNRHYSHDTMKRPTTTVAIKMPPACDGTPGRRDAVLREALRSYVCALVAPVAEGVTAKVVSHKKRQDYRFRFPKSRKKKNYQVSRIKEKKYQVSRIKKKTKKKTKLPPEKRLTCE